MCCDWSATQPRSLFRQVLGKPRSEMDVPKNFAQPLDGGGCVVYQNSPYLL
jgi:hypothetical protein